MYAMSFSSTRQLKSRRLLQHQGELNTYPNSDLHKINCITLKVAFLMFTSKGCMCCDVYGQILKLYA